MFKIGDTEYQHWFDGMAYMQRYHFVNGKMYYSARILESDDYKGNMKAKRIIAGSFGTRTFPDPCKTLFERLASYFQPDKSIDNCLISFTTVRDSVHALIETPAMIKIDPDSLDNLGKVDLRDHLKVSIHSCTAHVHTDKDNNIYNIGSMFGPSSKYVFAKTKTPRKGEAIADFENTELLGMVAATDPWAPSYYHSFGITENYFVLFECSEKINLRKVMLKNYIALSVQECMYYDSNHLVNIILFDRISRKKVEEKIISDAFFTFHHANTYEKDGFIVVDYCKMVNPGNFDDFNLNHIRNGSLKSKIVKVDLIDGSHKVWHKDAEDQICAEPILVNRPDYSTEDEGVAESSVLLVPVITTNKNDTPYLAVLSAETLEEQARYVIPQSRIPLGFHAHYISRPELL